MSAEFISMCDERMKNVMEFDGTLVADAFRLSLVIA